MIRHLSAATSADLISLLSEAEREIRVSATSESVDAAEPGRNPWIDLKVLVERELERRGFVRESGRSRPTNERPNDKKGCAPT